MTKKVYLTADPHFGHANIITYTRRLDFLTESDAAQVGDPNFRPSPESVHRMNDGTRDSINRVVGEDDTLWILGDFHFASADRRLEMAFKFRRGLRCRDVRLIGGNHDDPGMHEVFDHFYGPKVEYHNGVKVEVHSIVRTNIQGQKVVMSHFPMAVWDNSYRGEWMLYGHCHKTAEEWLDRIMPHRKAMDVGIDNAKRLLGEYRPFSFEEIRKYMEPRMGHHEYRKQQEAAWGGK